MKLLVEKNGNYKKSFIKWLLSTLEMELLANVNLKRLKALNNYINEKLTESTLVRFSNINLNTVMLLASRNLTFYETKNYYCIQVNQKLFFPVTKFRLYKLCEFINYGNLEISGCNTFTTVFANIAENIEDYYHLYCLDKGLI